ncbi:MAG: gliding motility-associated ABC transporter permease subunit GldF [Cytophagales bacterium]|nr:gliding motility-associated ABC transporter permease subunit GldF [Cytophagales bacterium]
MLSIYRKEIKSFFNDLIAYLVIILFLTGIGLYMWVFPDTVFDYGEADMNLLFVVAPYVYMFLIPAITMRSFAEEKKTGTIELLLTRPITEWQLVLGKFLASFSLVVFALIPTLVYYIAIYQLGNPVGNLDSAGIVGSYIGLLCLGASFTAVGVFTSSLTKNQIVAFIISVFLSLFLFEGTSYLSELVSNQYAFGISQLSFSYHYTAMSKGVIDTRNAVFFISIVVLMLLTTRLVLVSRKW